MSRLRTALLFQDGNFVGREYCARLAAAGRLPDLIVAVGRMKPESVAFERARTGGLWTPPAPPRLDARFDRLDDPALAELLRGVDVAVQGGIGIIRPALLAAPRVGWLNIHPGALPAYRGNACPEWALLNGDPVVATAHLIDEGIDTGPVICARPIDHRAFASYEAFRAALYAHCAAVLIEALGRLESEEGDPRAAARPQPAEGACYRQPMPAADLARVRGLFSSLATATP